MKDRLLLVDFENVQKVDLSGLDEHYCVTVFVGSSQKSVPIDLVQGAQPLGARLEWLRVDGSGKNALDFHIAYHLGCCFTRSATAEAVILSRDSGFDPLVRHLNKQGRRCRRINSMMEMAPGPAPTSDANYRRVVEVLSGGAKKGRPRRRATLIRHIAALFANKLPQAEVERLVDLLFVEGKVSETNQALSYSL